ncbi:MAG: hypothetical protein J6Y19_09590, partial [Kiritimatiellae bacterium]|nr:hypothetical protein [Kiritimatiellia bacterium]
GGGVEAKVEDSLSVRRGNTVWREWQAANDGFFQLQARTQKPAEGEVQLRLLDSNRKVLVVVTSLGGAGQPGNLRRLLWTVPVRAGDRVELAVRPGDGIDSFALTSVKAQFIYFGVPE